MTPSPAGSAANRPTVEVAAGLIFRGDRLLLAQRPPGTHLAGRWEFPGGKRESGESYEACLERELREELGVTVRVGECVFSQSHDYAERAVHLRFFLCELVRGEPRGLDGQELAWVRREELGAYAFPPADADLVARLRNEAGWWKPRSDG